MPELDADFEISTNNLEAEYEITQSEHFDCSFEIFAAGTPWGEITGNIEDQTDLQDILTDLQSNIDDVADDLSIETDNRQSADTDLQDNIDTVDGKIDTHIADKINPHEVTKTQVGLGNVDNTSDLNKPISTATQTALNGKQNTINDLSEIRSNASNGQSAYNTIQNYGDIVTYDASSFATSTQGSKADTALQPNDNISELNNDAGYITSASLPTVNNSTVKFQKNGTDIETITLNQSTNSTVNFSIPTQASDINAVPTSRKVNNKALSSDITLTASDVNALSSSTTINDLTTTAQQNAINSGATSTNIGQITTNTNDISDINDLIPIQATSSNQLADKSFVNSSIATNTANFIGTFQSVAELEAYSGTLTNNDYAFVETTDTAGNTLFDRYKYTTATTPASWQYEYELNNSSFTANQWASINSGITSNDVTLIGTALQPNDNVSSLTNDAGYITSSSLPTVNNGTLTIQQNGTDVQIFTANQSSNATANIITPTKTSDLTNDSGFIDNSALSNYATQTDLTNGLATKQDTISDLSTIRSNATNGQSAYTTIGSYGDIVTHNTSEFATSAQGGLADTSIQPNDNISLLNNDAGYTSNVGTVTSVNNTQPDANGNVTISVTGGANTDLSNLTATGESHFQAPLVSGTNIKTINSVSLLGSGNISLQPTLVSGTNIKTVNNTSLLGSGDISVGSYSAGTGLSLSGTTFNHSNSVTAGTIGTEAATSGSTLYVPYATYDAQGHITRKGTHTHTVTGFLTSSSSQVASSRFDGAVVYKYSEHDMTTSAGTKTISLSSYLPSGSSSYLVLITGYANNNNSTIAAVDIKGSSSMTTPLRLLRAGSNGRYQQNSVWLPVDSSKTITITVVNTISNTLIIELCAYRRIGTNS